jgi:uncharacterized membrane protein YhaH (DUF805 family)
VAAGVPGEPAGARLKPVAGFFMGVLLRGPCTAMSTAWKRWQDWGSVVIGVLFFITPFVFGATANSAAAYTAYIGGVLLLIAGLWNLATPGNQAVE